ncbi:transcriptional repressor NrdR [Candidatus Woesearchaeota archaeon]|nr:MAG: transcriptional repressor NrdR [Candidatus Woesearchaeota archaeon]
MKCPYCQKENTKVVDSRVTPDSCSIRRRRECASCSKRFTTYERIEMADIIVVKKDGRRESFSREKVLKGVMRACEKRPVKREKIEKVVNDIEATLRDMGKEEIKSRKIGTLVMESLAELDEVAYVRFASVYKKFRHANQFVEAIKTLKKMEVQ